VQFLVPTAAFEYVPAPHGRQTLAAQPPPEKEIIPNDKNRNIRMYLSLFSQKRRGVKKS
jgi:hypothetical protein